MALIKTTYGVLDESQLKKRVHTSQDQHGNGVRTVEYFMRGVDHPVHRSAHINLNGEGMSLLQGIF